MTNDEIFQKMSALANELALKAAEIAIEKCKNATGQREQIDKYVSALQCVEDALDS